MLRSILNGSVNFRSRTPTTISSFIKSASSSPPGAQTLITSALSTLSSPPIAPIIDSSPAKVIITPVTPIPPHLSSSINFRSRTPTMISSFIKSASSSPPGAQTLITSALCSRAVSSPPIAPIIESSPAKTIITPVTLIPHLSSPHLSSMKPTVRSYARFPSTVGKLPTRPVDAMDTGTLRHRSEEFFKDDFTTPDTAAVELKLVPCKNQDPTSTTPAFKVHNLRSSWVNEEGVLVNLNRHMPGKNSTEEDRNYHKYLMKTAKEMIALDMHIHGISESDMAKLWSPERGSVEDFWAMSLLKHGRFSCDEAICDYASTTYKLANSIINGNDNQPGLGKFLEMKKLFTGQYHQGTLLLDALEEFLTVAGYPTFVGHGGHHPSLFEVGVLATKDGTKIISHPMSTSIPKGQFLMRRL